MLDIRRLKPTVNQAETWEPLLEYLESQEQEAYSKLKSATTTEVLWEIKGQLILLDKLKRLRDRVNSATDKGEM